MKEIINYEVIGTSAGIGITFFDDEWPPELNEVDAIVGFKNKGDNIVIVDDEVAYAELILAATSKILSAALEVTLIAIDKQTNMITNEITVYRRV